MSVMIGPNCASSAVLTAPHAAPQASDMPSHACFSTATIGSQFSATQVPSATNAAVIAPIASTQGAAAATSPPIVSPSGASAAERAPNAVIAPPTASKTGPIAAPIPAMASAAFLIGSGS